jgi:pimeloyl-ACP methyl ester carboxylesterase
MNFNFCRVNGVQLHYAEQGKGPLVILLHGFPEFWYGWNKQIPVLSAYYRIVAPDMRGYNLSDKPNAVSAYKIEILAKDIADLVAALGEKKAIVVGHDWGAAVAWALAAFYPDVVEKLAILNVPHPKEMTRAFREFNLKQWRKSWYIFFFQLPLLPEAWVGKESFFYKVFRGMSRKRESFTAEDIEKYVNAFKHKGARRGAVNYYRAAFRAIASTPEYPSIKAPTMMLWGEQDKALGKELTLRTANYCAGPFEIFYDPESGHFLQHDNPDWVNEKLLQFFAI